MKTRESEESKKKESKRTHQACRSRDENCEMKIRKIASGQSSFGQTEELTRGANSLMIPEGAKGERDRDRILDLNPRD